MLYTDRIIMKEFLYQEIHNKITSNNYAIFFRAKIRSSTGGCVLNNLENT